MTSFDRMSSAEHVSEGIDLEGRYAIVTGANTGISRETSRVLALPGCSVTLACRNLEKANAARSGILQSCVFSILVQPGIAGV